MSIDSEEDLQGIQAISEVVAQTLRAMREYAQPGMSAKELDEYGGQLLKEAGARSAPILTYDFPGHTCICVNEEAAHGIPKSEKIFREGDLINIDVSAELNGFWADNGGSFVLGEDTHGHQALVDASREILQEALDAVHAGMRINQVGKIIQNGAKARGYRVIKNLAGHGVGRSLHEAPNEILNYYDRWNRGRFANNSVVAIETFISTQSDYTDTLEDGWTLVGEKGGFVAQHEHTLIVTEGKPVILTASNGIWE
jgi:methionyl aminopeptidase